jgi:hypothetical protein
MRRGYLDLDDDDDCEVKDGESVRTPLFLTDTVRFENHQPHFVRATAGADLNLADHQPGFRYATDAARAAVRDARDQMIRRAESAWRLDARPQFTCPECHGTGKDPDGDSDDDKCDECGGTGSIRGPNRLSSFQRRDPGPYPDADLRLDRKRRPPDDDDDDDADDARRRKRAARDAYVRKICDAWRTPARDAAEPDNSSPPEVMRRHLRGDEPDHDAGAMLRGHLSTEASAGAQAKRDAAWARYRDNLQNAWQRGRTDPKEADRIMRQAASEKWKHGAA